MTMKDFLDKHIQVPVELVVAAGAVVMYGKSNRLAQTEAVAIPRTLLNALENAFTSIGMNLDSPRNFYKENQHYPREGQMVVVQVSEDRGMPYVILAYRQRGKWYDKDNTALLPGEVVKRWRRIRSEEWYDI